MKDYFLNIVKGRRNRLGSDFRNQNYFHPVKYIVEYIVESRRRRERRERAEENNGLHCIESNDNNEYKDLYL
jgi:hypothetical protein